MRKFTTTTYSGKDKDGKKIIDRQVELSLDCDVSKYPAEFVAKVFAEKLIVRAQIQVTSWMNALDENKQPKFTAVEIGEKLSGLDLVTASSRTAKPDNVIEAEQVLVMAGMSDSALSTLGFDVDRAKLTAQAKIAQPVVDQWKADRKAEKESKADKKEKSA